MAREPKHIKPARSDVSHVPFYFEDADSGTALLNNDQFTLYWRLIFKMWSWGGPLPLRTEQDERALARRCGFSLRKFRTVLDQLVDNGKIERDYEGFIFQFRAIFTLENARKRRDKLSENGRKGGEKSGELRRKTAEVCERILSGASSKASSKNEAKSEATLEPPKPKPFKPPISPLEDPSPPSQPSACEVDDAALSPEGASASSPRDPKLGFDLVRSLQNLQARNHGKVSK